MPPNAAPESIDQIQDPEDLGAVPNHLAIPGLTPAEDTLAVDHEGRAPCDVAVGVEHAVGADRRTVQVAQQRERQLRRGREGGVACGDVAANRSEESRVALERG